VRSFGGLDIVINNAGVVITAEFSDLSVADLDSCYAVHVRGAFLVCKAAWSYLAKADGGRVLNVCSVDGVLFGNQRHTAYDAAKGGLAGLTRGLAADGRDLGIGVNGLLPGAMTRGHASIDHALSPAAVIDMRPELVAPAAAWLVHHDCPVTGRFYAASSGRMGLVFTAAAEGHQSVPGDFTLETVSENWTTIDARENFVVPDTTADYNEMRTRVFRSVVTPAGDSRD
jgi:NAD(P)-dependent dehydrogenase (short-subunit alcohol dehydrogenase family)